MTVFDASVVVDALVAAGPPGEDARQALDGVEELAVPAIFAAEVLSALRRLRLAGTLGEEVVGAAVDAIATLRTVDHPLPPFVDRVWALRDSMTVYDAAYVALAESLGTDLVTADRRLARAGGARCRVLDVATFVGGRRPGR